MNMFEYFHEHSFLAFIALMCATASVHAAGVLACRTYRMVMILCRGWPPAHLDSDGDWKPTSKEADSKEDTP